MEYFKVHQCSATMCTQWKHTQHCRINNTHAIKMSTQAKSKHVILGDNTEAAVLRVSQQRKQQRSSSSRRSRDKVHVSHPDVGEERATNTQRVSAVVDSDSDLSDTERSSVLPSGGLPPQLELRPEVIPTEDRSPRGAPRGPKGYGFPDVLPPPFNSWSLGQLSAFYSAEKRGALRRKPVGPLERFLERLLELERRRFQTVLEERGGPTAPSAARSCHGSAKNATSRLSSPKRILQCQRAFPLTFLSSPAPPSAALSGCACTQCQLHYASCALLCCRSQHRGAPSLPKRSCSESRARAGETPPPARLNGSVTTNGHMRRMQALGNIRHPVQAADSKPVRCKSATRRGREHPAALTSNTSDLTRGRSVSERRKSAEKQPYLSKRSNTFRENDYVELSFLT
ncbi:protein FAM217B-like [Nerophis ophidion]|uniref:protein FAM217B-like n=1 Tax=Nerophis ophidion TaxID=159077 RepID=UPI002AE02074|nr:protein FAM217B-like [Nerophis ophidion]